MSTFPTTTNPTTTTPPRKTQRGSVALVALTALVVVFIIGLGLLTLGGNARLSGKRAMRLNGAQAIASAGIEYGDWQAIFNNQPLPYTNTRSLGKGQFTVSVTDNSASIAGTMKIVSTGIQSGDSVKMTRILPGKKTVFDYALCSGSALSIAQAVTTGSLSANGDIGANGSILLTKNGTVVNGNATATGSSISIKSITGKQTPQSASSTFLTADQSSGTTIANPGTFTGTYTFPPPVGGIYPVIIINGNLNITGATIGGVGTLIVNGTLTIAGNVAYAPVVPAGLPYNKVAVVATAGIIVSSSAPCSIVGFYYCHNSLSSASFQQTDSLGLTVTSGGIAADSFTNFSGPLSATHDSAMNATLGRQLHLPGY